MGASSVCKNQLMRDRYRISRYKGGEAYAPPPFFLVLTMSEGVRLALCPDTHCITAYVMVCANSCNASPRRSSAKAFSLMRLLLYLGHNTHSRKG